MLIRKRKNTENIFKLYKQKTIRCTQCSLYPKLHCSKVLKADEICV
jgi:hypothetical protein